MDVMLFAIESPTIIILVVAAIFLLFGGSKLPQLAKALGQSKKAFKEGLDSADQDDRKDPRAKLDSVDDEALFEEARRRAQAIRTEETRKIERENQAPSGAGLKVQSENLPGVKVSELPRAHCFCFSRGEASPRNLTFIGCWLSFPRPASPLALRETSRCVAPGR